jgi:competence protein ComEC
VLPPPEAFRLVAFDVGQGDALLVEGVDTAIMVDTGGSPVSDFDPGTAVLAPALRARGIDALDAVVVTHLDADHAGGLAGLLDEIDVAEVWTSAFAADTAAGRRLLEAAGEVPVRTPAAGAAARIGSCTWRVLYPPTLPAGRRPALASNDRSLIIALRCGRRALLLTGDGEHAAEARYAPSLSLPEGTLLKSPHHGSRTSSGAPLLDAVASRHVVISAGWRNRFGLPDAVVLERYRSRGMAVYRTDRDGAVTVNAGRRIRVSGERWSAGRGRHVVGGWLN